MRYILLLLCCAVIFHGVLVYAGDDDITGINPVLILIGDIEDYIIVDIRDISLYEKSRIPSALHIPLASLNTNHILESINKKIIIYAETDENAKEGLRILQSKGISGIYIIIGGLNEWLKAGGKIDKESIYQIGIPKKYEIPRGVCTPLEPNMVIERE